MTRNRIITSVLALVALIIGWYFTNFTSAEAPPITIIEPIVAPATEAPAAVPTVETPSTTVEETILTAPATVPAAEPVVAPAS